MNETKFIKTVTFGGYDKADTDEHIKALYLRISALESELKIAEFSLENAKSGTPAEVIRDRLVAEMRDRISEYTAENKSLADKLNSALAENKKQENEINNLKYSVAELEHDLSNADMKLASMSQKDDTAVFGAVFATAKKSASEILESARKKASDIEADSRKLAENIVAEANNKAVDIVYEAEVYAAEMTAEVSEENIKAVSGNVKALLLEDVNSLSACMEKFRVSFAELLAEGNNILKKSGNMLAETRGTLVQGGVPVFRNIEIDADLPDKPVYEKTDYSYSVSQNENANINKIKPEVSKKTVEYNEEDYQENYSNSDNFDSYDYDYDEEMPNFEELDAVDMLEDEDDFDLSGLVRSASRGGGGVNFKALDRQAEEFMGKKKTENQAKSGSINLAELTAQAENLADDAPPKKAKSGGIDLATLAAQAAALDE